MATADRQMCTPCSRRKETTKAVNICKVCNQSFCKACLEYHDRIFGVNNHDMISVFSQNEPDVRGDLSATRVTMCSHHPMQPVTLYCFPHNEVFCQQCKAESHCECIGVEYIAQACQGFGKTAELDARRQGLDAVMRRLIDVRAHRRNDQQRIEEEKEVAMASIRDFRLRMIELLDKMEKEALSQVQSKFCCYHSRIATDLQSCEQMIHSIEQSIQNYNNVTIENEAFQMFIFDKTSRSTIDSGRQSADAIEASLSRESLQFDLDTHIEEELKQSCLLKCVNENEVGQVPNEQVVEKNPNKLEIGESKNVNIAMSGETSCNIRSVCQLDDGWFIMVDEANSNVKVLTESLDLVSMTPIGQWPTQVCQSGPGEVSVGMEYYTSGAVIQLEFEMQNGTRTLVRKSKLKMKHYCLSLCYLDGEYYVVDLSGKVHCYSRTGTWLKLVYRGTSVKDIAIGNDFLTLFVADDIEGLMILEKSGAGFQQQRKVGYPFEKPTGLAVDITGGVFVCDRKVKNVFLVSKSGIDISFAILGFDPERKKPKGLCYDAKNCRLIICYHESTSVEVVTLLR